MLSMNIYPQQYIDDCRINIDRQLAAYDHLAQQVLNKAGVDSAQLEAMEIFETVFFNNMVIVLDHYFCHRSRTLEMKDGNPLNEVRMLCNSLMENHNRMKAENSIKYDAGKSVLNHKIGEEIQLKKDDFVRLSAAFFADLERKFL